MYAAFSCTDSPAAKYSTKKSSTDSDRKMARTTALELDRGRLLNGTVFRYCSARYRSTLLLL